MLKKGAETRSSIVKTALNLFEKSGFHRVGLPEIAKKVGIAHASVYAYFRNKEELLEACVIEAFEQGRAFVDADYDEFDAADKKLMGLVRGNMRAAFEPKPLLVAQVLTLYYFSRFNPSLFKLLRATSEATIGRIEGQLRQGTREKLWKLSDERSVALAIHALLLGEMFKAVLGLQEQSQARCTERVCSAVKSLIDNR